MTELYGIGNDITEIARIEQSIERFSERFISRIFTAKEQEYCLRNRKNSAQHFAARFAAKEAVVKALGTGFRKGISWLDIEIINDANGKPTVTLSKKILDSVGDITIMISLSHSRDYATAVAIAIN